VVTGMGLLGVASVGDDAGHGHGIN
jgi:hypothetical protein